MPAAKQMLPASCFGMPPLALADRKVAAAERIPPFLFYLPLALNWIWLGLRHFSLTLPTAANPSIFTGGMWGETKSSYFLDVGAGERRWIADFVLVERHAGAASADLADARRAVAEAGLDFPLIAKPDIGWHGHGVRRIDDDAQLARYIAQFPEIRHAHAAALRAACRRGGGALWPAAGRGERPHPVAHLPLFPACGRRRPPDGARTHRRRRARALEIGPASGRRPEPSRGRCGRSRPRSGAAARWCASR